MVMGMMSWMRNCCLILVIFLLFKEIKWKQKKTKVGSKSKLLKQNEKRCKIMRLVAVYEVISWEINQHKLFAYHLHTLHHMDRFDFGITLSWPLNPTVRTIIDVQKNHTIDTFCLKRQKNWTIGSSWMWIFISTKLSYLGDNEYAFDSW